MSDFLSKVSTRDKNGYLNCNLCTRIFFSSTGLEIHLKINREPKTVSELESKIKEDRINVDEIVEHITLLPDQQPNQSLDLKSEKISSPLWIKNQQCDNLTPQECPECQKSVIYLKKHINTVHRKLRPYKCKNCEKTFAQISNFQVHINLVHKKLKPYKCHICEKSFGQKADTKKHENFVHQILAKQQCQECKKSFRDIKYLQGHIRSNHKQIRPYQCDKCSLSFWIKSSLNHHIKRVHGKATLGLSS